MFSMSVHSYILPYVEAAYSGHEGLVPGAPDNNARLALPHRASWPPGEWCICDQTTAVFRLLQGPYKAATHFL